MQSHRLILSLDEEGDLAGKFLVCTLIPVKRLDKFGLLRDLADDAFPVPFDNVTVSRPHRGEQRCKNAIESLLSGIAFLHSGPLKHALSYALP